jgi:hypothetical protein
MLIYVMMANDEVDSTYELELPVSNKRDLAQRLVINFMKIIIK